MSVAPTVRRRTAVLRVLAAAVRMTALGTAAHAALAAAAEFTAQPLPERAPPPAGATLFEILDPERTGVNVVNRFDDPRMWGDRFRELTLGAVETGIAVADFDRDGRLDIFTVSKNGPCSLYRQVAPFQFTDVAGAAGVSCDEPGSSKTGATVVDSNADGWPDLYVCRYDAPNLLFVNRGDGTFEEQAGPRGLGLRDASVQAVFADYDRDGDLDCYLVTNILDFATSPQGRRDFLLRNDGTGHFADVSTAAGIWGLTQGHTAVWFDANHDGWPDLYVANDFETPDRLYLNRGDGTFADVADERLPHVTYFSMGVDAGDLNNDGLVDFMVADMRDRTHAEFMTGMEEIGRGLWEVERPPQLIPQYMWNAVYLNSGTDRYLEVARLAGLAATGWTWATRLADLDNDGRLDVFVTAGMIRNFIDADLVDRQNVAPTLTARAAVWKHAPVRNETTLAYRNLGDLRFADVSRHWGLARKGVSFGCALADLDGDGDLDVVFSNYNQPPTLARNHSATGHRVLVRLEGRPPNRDAVGAEVRLETDAGVQVRQVFTERGIVASEPATLHFGLGSATKIRRLIVRWPRGQEQVLRDLPVDHLLVVPEPAGAPGQPPPARLRTPPALDALFAEVAEDRGLKHVSVRQPFDELTRQRLLPRRLNGQGPALAAADVNGDGRVDLFVSGLGGQSGRLFLRGPEGGFTPAPEQPWSSAGEAEDAGAAFLDVDADGDADLLVIAGGVRQPRGHAALHDRLYLNDGRGRFSAAPDALPADGESTAAVATADFDGDGRTDVFIGGRVIPGSYPETPRSFLLRNIGGRLVDVTDELAPALRTIGMVTAAAWTDVDRDGRPDLLLALEWGPVTYFRNTSSGLVERTAEAGLSRRTGWWSALVPADINGDGRIDLVAGNVGLNTKYRASEAEPTLLFAGDLGGRGRTHLLEAQYEEGRLYPLRGRSKLAYSLPVLRQKFPTYRTFAAATVEDLFGRNRLDAARRLAATELASGVFIQQENGGFEFHPLPRLAQVAPIYAIVARDLDGDGRLDLYCAGNDFGPEPTTGRFDGGLSVVLKGDGRGGFEPLSPAKAGISVPGEVRAALALPGATDGRIELVVARCEGPLLLFAPRSGQALARDER